VPDSALITVLTGTGCAGVFCVLFILGLIYPRPVVEDLKAERNALRMAVQAERDRADAAVAAAQTTRDLLQALQAGVSMGIGQQQRASPGALPGTQAAP